MLWWHSFTAIGCFEGICRMQVKEDSKSYQAALGHVVYVLHKSLKELEWLQQLDIIVPLCIDETVEWCNSFVLVSELSGKVRLCLGPARLNQTVIRPVHRDPTVKDIFPKLTHVKYLTYICLFWVPQPEAQWKMILFNYIFVSVWHIHMQAINFCISFSRCHVPERER